LELSNSQAPAAARAAAYKRIVAIGVWSLSRVSNLVHPQYKSEYYPPMVNMQSVDLWVQATVIINTAIAAILGSIIGWERDRAGKAAGPRTMALVAVASAAIVAIGAVVGAASQFGDPTRALHAIMTGIGFLGAGLIFTNKNSGTQGVTTAATIFATAAMGVSVGLGFQVVGLGLTIIILSILRSTQVLEAAASRKES